MAGANAKHAAEKGASDEPTTPSASDKLSFAENAAEQTGLSKRTIERAVATAEAISPAAMALSLRKNLDATFAAEVVERMKQDAQERKAQAKGQPRGMKKASQVKQISPGKIEAAAVVKNCVQLYTKAYFRGTSKAARSSSGNVRPSLESLGWAFLPVSING